MIRRPKVNGGGGVNRDGLLAPGDPAPVAVINGGARSPFLIVCDHAGRATPGALGLMGASPDAFERHIAWDIGAGALANRLAHSLNACVIQQTYSRLVIDCNRNPERADAIVEVSDGTLIPANANLTSAEVSARVEMIHAPYHARIAAELNLRADKGLETVVVAIHSFTPRMNGLARPWQVGVLHLGNSRVSQAMLASLANEAELIVGDNEPYAMAGIDYTVPLHAIGRGLDYLELEVRQDLIGDESGQAVWSARLAHHILGVTKA